MIVPCISEIYVVDTLRCVNESIASNAIPLGGLKGPNRIRVVSEASVITSLSEGDDRLSDSVTVIQNSRPRLILRRLL
jgi:hypothetical protein